MELLNRLLELTDEFRKQDVPYAICGGLAMAVQGVPRATQDIDLLVPEDCVTKALEVAKTKGFWIPSGRMPLKARTPLATSVYPVSKAMGSYLIPLDLILVSPSLQQVWNGRLEGKIGDRSLTVVSRDGLIEMKRIAGRHRDLDDIERLTESSNDDQTDVT